MSEFYLSAMRPASKILFALALLLPIAALTMSMSVGPGFGFSPFRLLISVAQALQSAMLPLFGAALLWRIDQWLGRVDKPKERAE